MKKSENTVQNLDGPLVRTNRAVEKIIIYSPKRGLTRRGFEYIKYVLEFLTSSYDESQIATRRGFEYVLYLTSKICAHKCAVELKFTKQGN